MEILVVILKNTGWSQRGKTVFILVLCVGFMVWPGSPVHAETIYWNMPSGGSWETAGNWTPVKQPSAGDNVVISANGAGTITIQSNPRIYNVIISGDKNLAVISGKLTLGPLLEIGCAISGNTYSWIESNIIYNGVDLGNTTAEGTMTFGESGTLDLLTSDGYKSGGIWYFNSNNQLILNWQTPEVQTDTMTIVSCSPAAFFATVTWSRPDKSNGSMDMSMTHMTKVN
jgi:hypothetical protein